MEDYLPNGEMLISCLFRAWKVSQAKKEKKIYTPKICIVNEAEKANYCEPQSMIAKMHCSWEDSSYLLGYQAHTHISKDANRRPSLWMPICLTPLFHTIFNRNMETQWSQLKKRHNPPTRFCHLILSLPFLSPLVVLFLYWWNVNPAHGPVDSGKSSGR